MIRSQRARHARTWMLLGPTLVAMLVLLWIARPHADTPLPRPEPTPGASP